MTDLSSFSKLKEFGAIVEKSIFIQYLILLESEILVTKKKEEIKSIS